MALFIGGMALNVFVLPTILDRTSAVPRAQSVPTAIALVGFFTIPYSLLGLYLPALSTTVGALLWAYVALYRNTADEQSAEEPAQAYAAAD